MRNILKIKKTNLNLYSEENQRRYPKVNYPLTHLIDHLGKKYSFIITENTFSKWKRAFYQFFFPLIISCFLFRSHVYIYNHLLGPFHIDEEYLSMRNNSNSNIKLIKEWLWNDEYFQLELGLDPFYTQKQHQPIHQYSHFPNQHHLGTFKRIVGFNVYVKLPTRRLSSFHQRFPFQWKFFSVSTLQCIVQRLKLSNTNDQINNFFEKKDYIQFIDEQYNQNSTRFNILVLSHCGIFIGHFSRIQQKNVFKSNTYFQFDSKTRIFDISSAYISNGLLMFTIVFHLISFAWFFVRLMKHLKELIEIRFYSQLIIPQEVIEELNRLNVNQKFEEKLLLLDELIQETPYRLNNKLFVLKPNESIACIVLFRFDFDDELNDFLENQSPFIICPISKIRKINFLLGISYRDDSYWTHWPSLQDAHQFNYADWLHHILIETDRSYQENFDAQIKLKNRLQSNDNASQWIRHRRINVQNIDINETDYQLNDLIREEQRRSRLDRERINFLDLIRDTSMPASPEFIARFRLEHLRNPKFCDLFMKTNQMSCQICLESFELDQSYAQWPCSSHIPHLFHFECMLQLLRRSNSCPLCRHQV